MFLVGDVCVPFDIRDMSVRYHPGASKQRHGELMDNKLELKIGDKCRYGPKDRPDRQKVGYVCGFTAYRDEPAYVMENALTGEWDWPIFIGEIWKVE